VISQQQENQNLLFDRVIQFNASELQGGNGSGLGLWISKVVMDKHNGKIGVVSSGVPGQGCIFYVEMPIVSCSSDIITHPVSLQRSMSLITSQDVSMNRSVVRNYEINQSDSRVYDSALVVDDSPLNRKMLRSIIKSSFERIEEAVDGIDAIDKYNASYALGFHFSIIFMDDSMPRMCGRDAIKELRHLGFKGAIVAVTGNVLVEDISALYEAGADCVCEKPVNKLKLMHMIHDLSLKNLV
jgi:CheY-like chemotaxis protein